MGVLRILERNGIRPDVIAGSSMGAQVGGAYAAGFPIDDLVAVWRSMNVGKVAKTLRPTIPWSGWSSGSQILRTVRSMVGDRLIEDLDIPFAAVATDLQKGEPYVITHGSLAEAIRASLSVPGLFTPVWLDERLLIDGGVTDPVPVSVARQLGADIVIAVDVLVCPEESNLGGIPALEPRERILGILGGTSAPAEDSPRRFHPSVFSVLFQMSTVFQKQVSLLQLILQPPDVLIRPDFSPDPPNYSDVKQGIEAGEQAAVRALPEILRVLGRNPKRRAAA